MHFLFIDLFVVITLIDFNNLNSSVISDSTVLIITTENKITDSDINLTVNSVNFDIWFPVSYIF